MNSKRINLLVLGILLGSIAGYCGAYLFYVPQIYSLNTQYNALERQRNALQAQYDTLEGQQNDLQDQYATLSSQHATLQSDNTAVKAQYRGLSNDVQDFDEMLQSYCSLEDSFSRVLCHDEVNLVSSLVSSITRPSDTWYSYEKIYDYIVDNVVYVYDIPLPYIHTCQYTILDGEDIVTSFTTNTWSEYIQTPQVTLDIEQGDCDDQAILAYAMIRYYTKYIHGTEYRLYIALIDFSSEWGHVAVLIPVANGHLCIVDPAGHYLTSSKYGSIASKDAYPELQKYDSHWSLEGGITNIDLYEVNIVTGTHTLVESGSLIQIADFLET